jgi:hypothetical protein
MTCDKITYDSYREAKKAISGLVKRKHGKFHVYKCSQCGGLHITTTGKGKLKRSVRPDKYTKRPTDINYRYPGKKKEFKQPKILSPPKLPDLNPQRLLTPLQRDILKHIIEHRK